MILHDSSEGKQCYGESFKKEIKEQCKNRIFIGGVYSIKCNGMSGNVGILPI